MADETPTPSEGEDTQNTETADDSVVAQAEKPDAVKNAIQAERERAKAAEKRANELAAKVEEFESANQSEVEKLTGKLTKEAEARKNAERKLLRFEVAAEKEVPAEAVDFLEGSTREELEAKADKLLELVKSRTETETEPDFDGGAREAPTDPKKPEDEHNDAVLALLGIQPNT